MTAATRTTYLGAAIFAGAAALAGMLAILVWFPPRPDRELGVWLWLIVRTGIAAGVSAALSFALLNWMGWRLRRGPLPVRAALLGAATVAGSHLLIGVASALLILAEAMVMPHWSFDFVRDIMMVSFFVSLYSAFWLLITLPVGIAAAGLVEWLEQRRSTKSPSPSSV